MGVKARVLPGFLDRVLEREVPNGGTVVDLMSGTGVVAAHCAGRFRVFANDVQAYAGVIARSFVGHEPRGREAFFASLDFECDLQSAYEQNLGALEVLYAPALEVEAQLLARFRGGDDGESWCEEYRDFLARSDAVYAGGAPVAVGEERPERDSPYRGARQLLGETSLERYRADPDLRPACLVTAYYANIYFGLRQCLVIDSLRAAIESLLPGVSATGVPKGQPGPDLAKKAHYLSALLHAASTATSSTSHFAQPRHLNKDTELRAMAIRRGVDIRASFEEFSAGIAAHVQATSYVGGNQCLVGDYSNLIDDQGAFRFSAPVDLVYLDPPYTQDNYSRFYHVLEVLTTYDYPPLERNAAGAVLRGRYPVIDRRFRSNFCRRAKVEGEFRRVARAAAAVGAKLVVSYSSPTGLLLREYARQDPKCEPVRRFEELCGEFYGDVSTERRAMTHSGQGDSNLRIEELLVVCREPR